MGFLRGLWSLVLIDYLLNRFASLECEVPEKMGGALLR